MRKRIHNKKDKIYYRKQLRNKLTPAEAFLWDHIKKKKLKGRKFRRQHSIEDFLVDFYCFSENLIVELDGDGHSKEHQIEYDEWRTKRLEQLGNKVIRFENREVFDHLEVVLEEIAHNFGSEGQPPRLPPMAESTPPKSRRRALLKYIKAGFDYIKKAAFFTKTAFRNYMEKIRGLLSNSKHISLGVF